MQKEAQPKFLTQPLYMLLATNGGVEQSARNLALYRAEQGRETHLCMLVKEQEAFDDLIAKGVIIHSYTQRFLFLNKFGKPGKAIRFFSLVALLFVTEQPKYLLLWAKELVIVTSIVKTFFSKTSIAAAYCIHTTGFLKHQSFFKRNLLKFLCKLIFCKNNLPLLSIGKYFLL